MTHEELLLLGKRICKARKSRHSTQEHTSAKIGISLRYYQMLERGEKSPSLNTLICIGTVLDVSIDYLLLGDLPKDLSHPVVEMFRQMTPMQKENAINILQLFLAGCKDTRQGKEDK